MATTLMTTEDMHTLPDGGERYELIDGEPRERSLPNREHGRVSLKLGAALFAHERDNAGGRAVVETSFRIRQHPDRTLVPDVAWVEADHWNAQQSGAAAIDGPPALVVEVVSPSDRHGELDAKVLEWLEAGAELVCVLDPFSRAAVLHVSGTTPRVFGADDTLDLGDVVPGFSLPVGSLFE